MIPVSTKVPAPALVRVKAPLTTPPTVKVLAVTVTWRLNRRITFVDRRSASQGVEFLRYLLANGTGASINMAIYLALTAALAMPPIAALAVASGAAMAFNYVASCRFAFRPGKS